MPAYSFEGQSPTISPDAFIHPTAVIIGDVEIQEGCYVGPGASLRGDFGKIKLSLESNVQDNCVIHGTIGSETVVSQYGHIGHGAILHGCTIGKGVLIGMNAVIMDNSIIGDYSIIGSCSFIKSNFSCEPMSLITGSPGKIKRKISKVEMEKKHEATQRYIELAKRSLYSLTPCQTQPAEK